MRRVLIWAGATAISLTASYVILYYVAALINAIFGFHAPNHYVITPIVK